MRKFIIILFGLLFCHKISSQNKQVLYGFAELPQTLLLNPGAETNYKFHVGIPGLSGVYASAGSSEINLEDLFYVRNTFEYKLNRALERLEERDFLNVNVQLDILNGGYRYDNKTYLSFGFYQELDLIGYYPKDIAELLLRGNGAFLNRSFSFSQINYKADVMGVLHAGITRNIDKKLTVGGRVKIYSSAANIQSGDNSGTFTTVLGQNNIYRHYLNDVDITLRSSGVLNADNKFTADNLVGGSLLGGNLGLGIDLGFTYHITPQIEVTGSILDLGFISYSKNIRTGTIKGDFDFDGINFQHDSSNRDYWQELGDDFKARVPRKENTDSYFLWRPTKINAAVKYSFGEIRPKECYTDTHKKYYGNAIGAHLFTILRPLGPQLAATAFFEANVSEKLHAKVTYTLDTYSYTNVGDYSYSNIGLGLAGTIGKVNLYGTLDNLLKLADLGTANSMSFQFGANIIFD